MNFGGFCDLKMRVTFIWIVLSFVQNAVFFDCPRDSWRWKIKEIDFRCPENKEYHCLLDETNAITEKCIEKTWMEAGSCPKYFISADKVDAYPCNETKGICPNELYWTNEVFKYNACLPTKPKMNEPATTDVILTREPPQSKTNKNVNGSKREGVSAVVIVLPMLLACAAMLGIAIILILYKQKRRTERSDTLFMDFISKREEDKNDKDQETQHNIMIDDECLQTHTSPLLNKDGQLPGILTLAIQTSDGKEVSGDGKFDYSERFESVGKIVERAVPLLNENGILILVAQSKKTMAEVAQAVALTCDTQEYPKGFKEFRDSFAEMDGSSKTTKCVVFNNCFNISLHDHKYIFKDLYEKQVASGGRLRFVLSFPMILWNARRVTLTAWELFNEKYILKFKDLEVRNSKYLAD